MTRTSRGDWFDIFSNRWELALRQRRYDDALTVAIAGYMLARELRDEGHQIASQAYMATALQRLDEKSTAALRARDRKLYACSFCGRSEKEVRIAVGAAGNICEECAATARSLFETESGKRLSGRFRAARRSRKGQNVEERPRARKVRRSGAKGRRGE